MKPWIKALADKRDADTANREIEARFHRNAQSVAPILFKQLCDEITSDIRDYASATGDREVKIPKQEPDAMTVRRDAFPAFILNIVLRDHIINFVGDSHNSTSSPTETFDGHIEIISKGLDQHYYRFAGEDHHAADTVSRYILEHMLDRPLI